MPIKKTWLLRLPEIRAELTAMEVPVVDRAVFERVFGVRRRRAIQLLHHFGGWQSGRTFLVDRLAVLRQLEPIEDSAEFALELQRRQRLVDFWSGCAARVPVRAVMIPWSRCITEPASRRRSVGLWYVARGLCGSARSSGETLCDLAGGGRRLRRFPRRGGELSSQRTCDGSRSARSPDWLKRQVLQDRFYARILTQQSGCRAVRESPGSIRLPWLRVRTWCG